MGEKGHSQAKESSGEDNLESVGKGKIGLDLLKWGFQ